MPGSIGPGAFKEIKIISFGSVSIKQQLTAFVKDEVKAKYLIAYRFLNTSAEKIVEEISEGVDFTAHLRSNTILRVIFGVDPKATWQWFKIPEPEREKLEDKVEASITLKLWDIAGIRQRLEMESIEGNPIMANDRLLNRIIDTTGGWPYLLDEFINRCKKESLEGVIKSINQDLENKDSSLQKSFIRSIWIDETNPVKILNYLSKKEHQEMLRSEPAYHELLQLAFPEFSPDEVNTCLQFLNKMCLIKTDPYLSINSAIARAWKSD